MFGQPSFTIQLPKGYRQKFNKIQQTELNCERKFWQTNEKRNSA